MKEEHINDPVPDLGSETDKFKVLAIGAIIFFTWLALTIYVMWIL